MALVAAASAVIWYIDRVKDMRYARPVSPGELLDRIGIEVERAPETIVTDELRAALRLCVKCRHNRRCQRWLRGERPADDYHAFCPNAALFDQLRHQHHAPGTQSLLEGLW
jgi:hypothetical protein